MADYSLYSSLNFTVKGILHQCRVCLKFGIEYGQVMAAGIPVFVQYSHLFIRGCRPHNHGQKQVEPLIIVPFGNAQDIEPALPFIGELAAALVQDEFRQGSFIGSFTRRAGF
jgi:hypothetical protein